MAQSFSILNYQFSIPPDGALGAVAQLGEHLVCNQGVVGSIPISSTNHSASRLSSRVSTVFTITPSCPASIFAIFSASLTIEYG